jgi:arylsulfatase A-like enzyme
MSSSDGSSSTASRVPPPRAGRSRIVALCALVLAGMLARGACADPLPHVVVVVIDTLRADRLGGAYGSARGLTPFLDALAARGTAFTAAYATSSWTSPSVASLLTSRFPSQHRVETYFSALRPDETTLAAVLRRAGYATAAFSANPVLAPVLGSGRFGVWHMHPTAPKLPADRLTAKALRWVDAVRRRRPGTPLFLYLQYMEPHAPYRPPQAYRDRFVAGAPAQAAEAARKLATLAWDDLSPAEVETLRGLYDAEVAAMDARLRDLFAALDARGILRDAVVVVTADHGEEFKDHGWLLHGTSLFEELVHVPLVVVSPPGRPADRPRGPVTQNVSLVDVAPTILSLVGLPSPPRFEGRALLPQSAPLPPVDVLAELSVNGEIAALQRHTEALVRDRVKLITPRQTGGAPAPPVVYDLAADPGEQHPDPPDVAPSAGRLLEALRRKTADLATRAAPAGEHQPLDDETKEKLRRLGYLL